VKGRWQMRSAARFISRLQFFVGNAAHSLDMYLEVNDLNVWNLWKT
jgi:hypothetical protein